MQPVISALEILLDSPQIVGDRPWALLTNHAAVTSRLEPSRAALSSTIPGRLVRLFAPEHGLDGVAQDMEAVDDGQDPLTGLPVRSLYGTDTATLEPSAEDLDGVDVLVVDLPDIGARYYTFAATMDAAMAACAGVGVELVVVDRPNPIGGDLREGGPVEAGFESFVSRLPTPIRHGLTIGEIALLLQRERHSSLELTVVPCRGWRRSWWWDDTGLPWIPPSPNIPTLETAALYPGICLVEATTLSEGRGTTRPFHLVGAPWIDGDELAERLRRLSLPGVDFGRARFRPQFGKHANAVCSGVELHITDRAALRPVSMGLHLLATIHDLEPHRFRWRREPYEFVSAVPALDLLTGSAEARQHIEGGRPLDPLLASWAGHVREFEGTLDGVLLHHDRE